MVVINKEGKCNYIRVLTFVEGQEIWEIEDPPIHLFTQAGTIAAQLSFAL